MALQKNLFFASCCLVIILLPAIVHATTVCTSDSCQNGGTCTPTAAGTAGTADTAYLCTCTAQYTGDSCQTALNGCDSNPCQSGGTCTNSTTGAYTCSCMTGRTGTHCETVLNSCDSSPCLNDGQCEMTTTGGYMCTCTEGRTGATCDTYTNKCDSSPCMFDGTCQNMDDGTYMCTCTTDRTGTQCQSVLNSCDSSPCLNDGQCETTTTGGYMCTCTEGRTGATCDTYTDKCDPSPCMFDGTCQNMDDGTYMCTCTTGRTGTQCQSVLNPCTSSPCMSGGTCQNMTDGTYACSCPVEKTGVRCQIKIESDEDDAMNCSAVPCQNNGTCDEDQCVCPSGTEGTYCENTVVVPASMVCDPPCENGGTCTDNQCICPTGTQGFQCQEVDDKCADVPCFYDGNCTQTGVGTYSCACPPHHTGNRCETWLGCALYPCARGECVSITNSAGAPARMCMNCPPLYTGDACETVISGTIPLRLKVTLNTPWQMEFATNQTRLNAAAQPLTEHLMDLICTEDTCRNFTLIGANSCPGSLRVHYQIRMSSGSTTVAAKDKLKEFIMDNETLTNLNVREKPEMITETETGELVIEGVKPTYGPIAGGTNVSVCGYNLDSVTISFGNQTCTVISRYELFVICRTAALSDSDPVDTQLEFKTRVGAVETAEATLQSVGTFTFMPDPTIGSIEPLITVEGGGQPVIIRGTNLNSVYAPQLVVTVNNGEVSREFTTPCTVVNSTEIKCQYPDIRKFSQSGRSRRSIQEIPSRYKRNTQVANVTVMVGLKLDGVTQYNEYAEIAVHEDPQIFTFKEAGRRDTWTLRAYRGEDEIQITGNGLTTVFQSSDYNVVVGSKPCPIIDTGITNQLIVCYPENQPGDLQVLVSYGVGRDPIRVGNIRFENSIWDNAPSKYAIISAIVVFLLILFVGIGFCCFNDMQEKRRLAHTATSTQRKFAWNRDSRFSKNRRHRSLRKTISTLIADSTSRGGKNLFRKNQDVLGIINTPNSSAKSSDASMIGPMPETRFNANYDSAATGNFFLRHFSKFVTTRRPSQPDPIYDVITGDVINPAFQLDDELHGVRLSCMSIDMESLDGKEYEEGCNSYATQLPIPQQPSTSSSIHPPPRENGIMAPPTPPPTPPPTGFAPPPPPPPPPPPLDVRF